MQRRYAAIAAAGALALSASPAMAHTRTKIKCGQTLTQSVRLTDDLVNCPVDGLVIGADGITVDLGGHTIDGVASAAECDVRPVNAGIRNAGYDRLTLVNGTIKQFDLGVEAGSDTNGMSDSRVRDLALRELRSGAISLGSGAGPAATSGNRIDGNDVRGVRCGAGIELNTGRGNRFADNRLRDVGSGVVICCGDADDGNVIARNDVARSASDGALVFFSGATRVTDNEFSDLGGAGVAVIGPSPNTVIADNRIVRAQGPGILAEADVATGDRITGNILAAVGDGILLFGVDRSLVTGNTVNGAGTFGPSENIGFGFLLDGASENLIAGNEFRGGRGPAIQIGADPDQEPSPITPTGNVVARNDASGNAADGIRVTAASRDTTVERNAADRNGGDGIHVLSPLTKLVRNNADRNARWGIEAVRGVTDGGGNHARGNVLGQCTGVAC